MESFHLSKEKLKSLLVEQEKFTEESAQYAIDNLEVDWKEQALEQAKVNQGITSSSKEKLKDLLINYEKFTEEEAQYAVDHLK